jgi:hypothetical protein
MSSLLALAMSTTETPPTLLLLLHVLLRRVLFSPLFNNNDSDNKLVGLVPDDLVRVLDTERVALSMGTYDQQQREAKRRGTNRGKRTSTWVLVLRTAVFDANK